MPAGLVAFWWDRVPLRVARASSGLALMLRDGVYVEAFPYVAAVAPVAALVLGFVAGWRHPLASDVYMSSLALMVAFLVVGALSGAIGLWLVLGWSLGDLVVGLRDPAFLGPITSSGRTWVALVLCDLVLAMLAVLVPLTARALANEAALRWMRRGGVVAESALAVVVTAVLAFAWAQAALVLTRPYFLWHGLPPSPAVVSTLRAATWVLPVVAIVAATARAWLEATFAHRVPPRVPLPQRARRTRMPVVLAVVAQVVLAVFLLAGLLDSWVDAVAVAVVMTVLLVLREPALRRAGVRGTLVMRLPVLPRLIAGAIISAVVAIVLVSIVGPGSVVRPIVISTLVSLVVFTLLLPDHVLVEHEHGTEAHAHATGGAAT